MRKVELRACPIRVESLARQKLPPLSLHLDAKRRRSLLFVCPPAR